MIITRLDNTDAQSPSMDRLFTIYADSIAVSEQKTRAELEAMLAKPYYYFHVLSHNSQITGLAITYAPLEGGYCLLEYIATDPLLRSHGYGGKLFSHIAGIFHDRPMILEVDSPYQPCEDMALREKRMSFYSRLGCRCIEGMHYILPLDNGEKPPEMVLLVHSGEQLPFIPKGQLTAWVTDIYTGVYGCAGNDPRIADMVSTLPAKVPVVEIG